MNIKKVLTFGLIALAGFTGFSSSKAAQKANAASENLVSNGDFNFYNSDKDLRLPTGDEPSQYGVFAYTVDQNSPGHIVQEDGNMVGKIFWDGVTTSTNADLWFTSSELGRKGAGKYIIEGDFKASAFTSSDFFGLALSGIRPDKTVMFKEVIVCLSANEFNNDHPVSDVLGDKGYKHFTRSITLDAGEAACWDTLQCNLFIHDSQRQTIRIDNVSVHKEGDTEEVLIRDGKYIGDFEQFANTPNFPGKQLDWNKPFFGYRMNKNNQSLSPAVLGHFDGVSGARLMYDGTNKISSLSKEISLGGQAGNYTVEFDFKLSPKADPYEFTALINCEDLRYTSCYNLYALTCIEDMEFLEDSESLPGYKHFSASTFIDALTAQHANVLSLAYDTNNNVENYVDVTNLSIKCKKSINPETAPTVDQSLVFNKIVQMGDFEDIAVNTTFVGEPTETTAFWGSINLDAPGVVLADGTNNHYLHIAGDGQHTYASAFVFLDPSQYSTDEIFRLEWDSKLTGNVPTAPYSARVSFVGGTGKESFAIPLCEDPTWGFHADGKRFTTGTNETIYPYTVTSKGNGWMHYCLDMKLNTQFMTTVDSIRFLINAQYTLDVDNVQFGKFAQKQVESVTISANKETVEIGSRIQFEAIANPSEVPVTSVEWYVNGQLIEGATSVSYSFKGEEVGEYTVSCKVNGVQSNTIKVNVTKAGNGGCKSSITLTSGLVGILSLVGLSLVSRKKKEEK